MKHRRLLAGLAGLTALIVLAFFIWGGARTPWLSTERYMVASADRRASEAGLDILAAGGTAVDAAIAVQAVLSLVEPQSSGLGGGAYMLHWDEATRTIDAYDGRETAPKGATPELFLESSGRPRGFFDAVISGESVGVPGVVAMLWMAHQEHGRLPWAKLFEPAIRLAENGFTLSPRLHALIAWSPMLPHLAKSRDYFFEEGPDGKPAPRAVGTTLRNPAYGTSLRRIARDGPDAFYKGPIAYEIIEAVHNAPTRAGTLSLDDLAGYVPIKRTALCRPYRHYRVCGMPPSTSGGLTTLQILGILSAFDLGALAPNSPEAVHLITEASRLAYADRDLYIGDSDVVDVPIEAMLDPAYLAARAHMIDPARSLGPAPVAAGTLPAQHGSNWAPNQSISRPSTSHFSIIDGEGRAVSMTTSVEAPFGSHLMAGGFFLNNQLTDFSFLPEKDGNPIANAVAPGKRPRSSMSPTLVFDDKGDLFAAIGSPGGSRIIAYVTQTLIALLDWGMDMQSAINLPRHVDRNGPLEVEEGTDLEALIPALQALGQEVVPAKLTSGLHGIRVTADGLDGGADPRREGAALAGPP